jgi:3-phenylpropionate/trans-cinnamate dioxygenase ferredoxin reductase component
MKTAIDRVVVVGASAAGLAAAETLRSEGFEGNLTIVGAEPHLPYDRPPLSKQVLDGRWSRERAFLRPLTVLSSLGAHWLLGTPARLLDRARRRLLLADGTELPYDGLVIATGVSARRLPGDDLAGVHVLRTLDDALAVRSELSAGNRMAIVGAGFLGCEVAAVARQLGLAVSLVDPLPGPMFRQLGPDVAACVAELHYHNGVSLRCGVGVERFAARRGRVTGLVLTDGSELDIDIVLVAVGSAPNTGWLDGSGLSLTDGVDCDEYCRAADRIVAAGDVASWRHVGLGKRIRVEHRTNAIEQGAAAARALLGIAISPFTPVPFFWSDQYDVKIQVHGVLDPSAEAVVVRGDPATGHFGLIYRQDKRSVAVLAWNMPRAALELREQLVAQSHALS